MPINDFDYAELARTEIRAFRREIERSRHQAFQEVAELDHRVIRHGSPEWHLHERHIMAKHIVRTFHLELQVAALSKHLLDIELVKGPQPIAAVRQ